jgi:curli biogenesis system outer membrane secretion channel CsgG
MMRDMEITNIQVNSFYTSFIRLNRLLGSVLVIGLLTLASAGHAASKLTFVDVTTEGSGKTINLAALDGLKMAVSQVNGATVAASTATSISSSMSGQGDSKEYLYSNAFQQQIETATKGVVKSWTILSERQDPNLGNLYFLKMRVTVAKYEESVQLQRLRLAFSYFGYYQAKGNRDDAYQMARETQERITDYLTQTRRFAIIDRQNMDRTQKELDLIQGEDFKVEEMARLGNKVGADYMVIGDITNATTKTTKQVMQSTGRTFKKTNSHLSLSLRIIDIATSQVKFADTFELYDETSLAILARDMSRQAGEFIINAIYPVRIVAVNGDQLTFGQGGDTIQRGRDYNIIRLGNRIFDPYTKESLGREETIIGTAKVISVQARTSTAKVSTLKEVTIEELASTDLLVRPVVMGKRNSKALAAKKSVKEVIKKGQESMDSFKKEVDNDW